MPESVEIVLSVNWRKWNTAYQVRPGNNSHKISCALLVGACEYLDILREDILVRATFRQKSILLGDFNLQIPPKGYHGKNSIVNQKREATFSGWTMPTAGACGVPALDKPFIDHIALSPDIRSRAPQFFNRFNADGTRLSDHNGVCIEIEFP